jgi:hypothetical protein
MIAYKNGVGDVFGVEARDQMHDEDTEIASWFKVEPF